MGQTSQSFCFVRFCTVVGRFCRPPVAKSFGRVRIGAVENQAPTFLYCFVLLLFGFRREPGLDPDTPGLFVRKCPEMSGFVRKSRNKSKRRNEQPPPCL